MGWNNVYKGDAKWFQRRHRALKKLDRWATATKYIAKESLRRRVTKTEKIWTDATSKGSRYNLNKQIKIHRLLPSYPTYATIGAIEIQRAFRCYSKRLRIWSATRLQKRWREHLNCVAIIRDALMKIQTRVIRGTLQAWHTYVDKCKRAKTFLKKIMANLRDKMFHSWGETTKYNIEDRNNKEKQAVAKKEKKGLYNCFHALHNWRLKMEKIRNLLKRRLMGIKGEKFNTWVTVIQRNLGQKHWVIKIQIWFRNLKIAIQRRILFKQYLHVQATVIQSRWRGVRLRLHYAAVKIQSMYRVWKACTTVFETETSFDQHEQIRKIVEKGVVHRAFSIDAPRIAGAWLGRPEYMGTEQRFNSHSNTQQNRIKQRKNVLAKLSNHLQQFFYLSNISKAKATGGVTWALEESINIACSMFDPMVEGRFPRIRMRNVMCQLLGPGKRKVGSSNLTGVKGCQELAESLDRDNSGYVKTELFKQWYMRNIGLQVGRPLIESALVDSKSTEEKMVAPTDTKKKKEHQKPLQKGSVAAELRIPAAEAAFFEAAKWLIRDHSSDHFRISGRSVGREPAAQLKKQNDDKKKKKKKKNKENGAGPRSNVDKKADKSFESPFQFHVLQENHPHLLIKPSELYRTTMPRFIAPDVPLHRKTFGTLKKMNEYLKLYESKDKHVIQEMNKMKRPPQKSIIMETYRWLMLDETMQTQLRSELFQMEDDVDINEGVLDKGLLGGLKHRSAAKEAAKRAAKNKKTRLKQEALLAKLDGVGKKHVCKDHKRPVRFMLQSFEESHEYRARWKTVDERIGRNGKKMRTYKGACYSSNTNSKGLCSITIETPRVGTYRVDIEQRFGAPSSATSSGEAGETGKCVKRLRQTIQQSKWESIVGSPKYIDAKFNILDNGQNAGVAGKMQKEKPKDVIDGADFNDADERRGTFSGLNSLDLKQGEWKMNQLD